jgi:hypothetical protein
MVARLGSQLYDDLLSIESRFMEKNGISSAEGIARAVRVSRGRMPGPVTLKDMMEYVVAQRQQMSAELSRLAGRYRTTDPLLANSLEKAAHEAGFSQSALNKIQDKMVDWATETYVDGRPADAILDYVRKLWGEMGELKVAVRVKGLVGRGLNVQDLGVFFGKGAVADAARARLAELRPVYPRDLGKELDLILDQGMLWGEIKNYSEVFSSEHRFYNKVMEQAQHTVEIRTLLESDPKINAALIATGKRIHFRIYLLGGVTESAAHELESMGFEVLGPRYLDDGTSAPFAPTGWLIQLPARGLNDGFERLAS